MSGVTPNAFKRAMASFAASVTVVTTLGDDGQHCGMTATAFSSLSLEPPLCLVCVDKGASMLGAFKATQRFAVNILASDQQALSIQFASEMSDRFDGIRHRVGHASSCALIEGAIATVECELQEIHPGGDHDILVGLVHATTVAEGAPLVYFRGGYADIVSRT